MLMNEKTEHRRLLNLIGRAHNPNCECQRVAEVWRNIHRRISTPLGGWKQLTLAVLIRPELNNIEKATKYVY
jgi:hypothetical protein